MSFSEGYDAAARGEPISACPWGPADPDGHSWRHGWIQSTANQKHNEGTFGASPEEHAAAIRSFGKTLNPDPFPELLEDKPRYITHSTNISSVTRRLNTDDLIASFQNLQITVTGVIDDISGIWSDLVKLLGGGPVDDQEPTPKRPYIPPPTPWQQFFIDDARYDFPLRWQPWPRAPA